MAGTSLNAVSAQVTAVHATAGASTSRARGHPRRKHNDDAPYIGAAGAEAGAGTKRSAQDKADGEPRAKRKRADHTHSAVHASTVQARMSPATGKHPNDTQNPVVSQVDFTALPIDALYKYVAHYELIPSIYPSPLSAEDPPPPLALLDPARMASRAPSPLSAIPLSLAQTTTVANRPRRSREARESSSRRRSSRLWEEEMRGAGAASRTPVLADVGEIHGVLAQLASRHFTEMGVIREREMDTLVSFMSVVRAGRENSR